MKMETYSRVGSWVMNSLGLYYLWVHITSDRSVRGPADFVEALFWGSILCIARYITTKYLFSKLGSQVIAYKRGKPQKVAKFATCAFKTVCFSILVVFEWSVLRDKEFTPRLLLGAGETEKLWTAGYTPPGALVSVFMASLGYHLHSTIYHVFVVDKRSDYHQMVLHHVLTLWLMILSYMEGHIRGGTFIVLLNDLPDIFVYSSKMLGDTVFFKSSIVSYVLLTITYFYCRLIVAPVSIYWSMMIEAETMSRFEVWVYSGFVGALYVLHFYWFILIVKIGLNIAKTGSRKDILADMACNDD